MEGVLMAKKTTSVSIDEEYKEIISAHEGVNFSGMVNNLAGRVSESLTEGEGVEVDATNEVLLELAREKREDAREDLEEALETFNRWDSMVQEALEEQQEAREMREECAAEVASFFRTVNPAYQKTDNGKLEKLSEECDLTPEQLLKKAHLDYKLTLPSHIDLDDVELPDDETETGAEVNPADDLVQQAREAVNAD